MGPINRKQRELEERRDLILSKSRELFFEKGFEQVTIQDICDAVEYGRSVIYSFFESKEEIYSHIYLESVRILIDLTKGIDPEAEDFNQEFMKIGEVMFSFYNDHTNYFKALSHFRTKGLIHSKIPQKILEEKERLYQESSKPIYLLLNNAMKKGLINPIDPEEILLLFYTSLIGIISMYISIDEMNNPDVIHQAVMKHTEIYCKGIRQ